jgi:hypothetical protein
MILTSKLLTIIIETNSGLHETGKGRKHINWWVNLTIMKGTINENLTLSNVSGKIWDRVSDIVVRHGQNGQLGDGTI